MIHEMTIRSLKRIARHGSWGRRDLLEPSHHHQRYERKEYGDGVHSFFLLPLLANNFSACAIRTLELQKWRPVSEDNKATSRMRR